MTNLVELLELKLDNAIGCSSDREHNGWRF
jgi:hypothetical protein